MIDTSAELNFYRGEYQGTIPLSEMQLYAVCKILGIHFATDCFLCYTDEKVKQLCEMEMNPLKELGEEEQ